MLVLYCLPCHTNLSTEVFKVLYCECHIGLYLILYFSTCKFFFVFMVDGSVILIDREISIASSHKPSKMITCYEINKCCCCSCSLFLYD